MNKNLWTAEAVQKAVLQDSNNLEIVFSNYLKAYIERLEGYEITLQGISDINQLHYKVLDGIEDLETLREELLAVLEIFAGSCHPFLKRFLPDFFERMLNFYENEGISLYSGTSSDVLRNDHYRFFNQLLFISITSLLIDNKCFDALQAIVCSKYMVNYKSYGVVRDVNFMRFREYNYTLNEFLNTSYPKRISITADYIAKYSGSNFEKFVSADIFLYYLSLWNHSSEMLDSYWFPELSVYNRKQFILPNLVSMKYFEEAKVLFGVDTTIQFKTLLDGTEDIFQRNGVYRVPLLKVGLMYDSVGSMD